MRSYEIYPDLVSTHRCARSCALTPFHSPEDDYVGIAPRRKDRCQGVCEAYAKVTRAGFQCQIHSFHRRLSNKHPSQTDTPPETLLETLSTLSILIVRFPAHFADPSLTPQPLIAIAPLLTHARPAVRKRAISTLSQFIPVAPPELFSTLLENNILPLLLPNANPEQQRTTVNLVAAIFRQSPQQLTRSLGDIVPGLLQAVKRDDEELREGCLQVAYMRLDLLVVTHLPKALETLLLRSPGEATPFVDSMVQVGLLYIKHDPVC